MMKGIVAVLAVSALMAGSAFATDKLKVQDSTGNNTVFKVDDAGAGIQVNNTSGAGKAVITGEGWIGVGHTAPLAAIHNKGATSPGSQIMMTRTDTNSTAGAGFIAYHNNITNASCTAAGTPSTCCTGAGAGTCPSTVLPQSNDRLGYFLFGGYGSDSVTPKNAAGMASRAEANWTDTLVPAYFAFETAGTATTGRFERFRISANGNVVTGNNGGAATVDMATNVTDGFLYIPNVANTLTSCASVKSYPGHSPIWFDTANAKVCTCQAGALKCTAALQ
jgi:hypothetical protein